MTSEAKAAYKLAWERARRKEPLPSPEQMAGSFTYDPETGVVTRMSTGATGTLIGGYLNFRVRGRLVKAHRLAWCLMTGEWPLENIDHINQDKTDNRWSNLRLLSQAGNMQNVSRPNSRNKAGALGVHLRKDRGTYIAVLGLNGQLHQLGSYQTLEEASAAYWEAKRRLHPAWNGEV